MAVEESSKEVLERTVAVCITFIVLNTIFVILRFISRFSAKQQKLALDDLLVIAGLVVNVGFCADALVICHYETIGNPSADTPIGAPSQIKSQLEPILKAIYAGEQLLYAGSSLPKLSLLFLYLRVFDGRWTKYVTWGLIGITSMCWTAFALTGAFLCRPVSYFWDRLIPGGECIEVDILWRCVPPFIIITDIGALLVPIPVIWKLHLSKLKKVGIILVFFTGGIGLVACCIRWGVYLTHSAHKIVPRITDTMLSWAVIESGMYQIAACLPLMRPLFIAIVPDSFLAKWNTWTGTSVAYLPGRHSSRASGRVVGGRSPAYVNRLPGEESIPTYSPSAEKTPFYESGASQFFAAPGDQIQLRDVPSRSMQRKVDVTITQL